MRTSTPNRRPTEMDQLRIRLRYIYSTWMDIVNAASKNTEACEGLRVNRESGGARGQCLVGSVRRNGSSWNRSPEPRSQGSILRGTLRGGGGCDPKQPGKLGRRQRLQNPAGRTSASFLANGAPACGGRRRVHRSSLPHARRLHENLASTGGFIAGMGNVGCDCRA